jgi:protein-(glutamine-N5) methyltransferase, release factor-specific
MTAGALYRRLREELSPVCGEFADYEARQILEHALALAPQALPLKLMEREPLPESVCRRIDEILLRRQKREPLAYILGETWFCGQKFHVTPDCLIPQADTELICESVIALAPAGARVTDICTGSGCIALSVLAVRRDASAVGYDISDGALAVARENARRMGLSERFSPVRADVFAGDFMEGDGLFDVIVSNPPYVASAVIPTLSPEVRAEPVIALDGGADGLRFYRRLLDVCPRHGKRGGYLVFEIGYDQREAVGALCRERGLVCEFSRDFGGNDRMCVISLS